MTREEFDSLYYEKAVRCDTKKKAKEFLALADSIGYKWFSGSNLIGRSYWETHEKETYYYVTNCGLVFGNINYIKQNGYQSVEYQPRPKFKVGDKVRVNNTLYPYLNGKVGFIQIVSSLTPMPYAVRTGIDELWYLNEDELEKVRRWTITAADLRYMLKVITEEKANSMTDEELEDFIVDTLIGEAYE